MCRGVERERERARERESERARERETEKGERERGRERERERERCGLRRTVTIRDDKVERDSAEDIHKTCLTPLGCGDECESERVSGWLGE